MPLTRKEAQDKLIALVDNIWPYLVGAHYAFKASGVTMHTPRLYDATPVKPADGEEPDIADLTLKNGNQVSWDNLIDLVQAKGVFPERFPGDLKVSSYTSPIGDGFILEIEIQYQGNTYEAAKVFGPAKWKQFGLRRKQLPPED